MKSERATRPTPEQRAGAWEWHEAVVDRSFDYFELRYGKVFESGGWDAWIPVAIVGRMRKGVVNVEFLINRTDPRNSKIVDDAVKELDFYLSELNKPDPWRYLQYHCGTLSNVYGSVHWSFMKRKRQSCRASECLVLPLP